MPDLLNPAGLEPATGHEFGPVDDCIRCIWCEALPHRATGPCTANPHHRDEVTR